MQILISCAKTMGFVPTEIPYTTQPSFLGEVSDSVHQMASMDASQLQKALHTTSKIAAENMLRYRHFYDDCNSEVPALAAYNGIVFKQISPDTLNRTDLEYAQEHMFITSFLYGLLRPFDVIRPYRMEGNVRLPDEDGPTRFEYWQPKLTDMLIDAVKADDGILVNLASSEMKRLFNWKRVCKEVKVVTPEFKVMQEGQWRTIVVYTKMCRGQMTRFMLKNHPLIIEDLYHFEADIDGVAAVTEIK